MPNVPFVENVEDSVPKVDNEVAVGEDLEFQRKWWRFEHAVWIFFTVIIVLAIAGVFGRGPLAKAHAEAPDGSVRVGYDRIQRTGTPSDLTVRFSDSAIQNGHISLFVQESLLGKLGAQRIAPQPLSSAVGQGGVNYTFEATAPPAKIVFALQPSGPTVTRFSINVAGHPPVERTVVVLP